MPYLRKIWIYGDKPHFLTDDTSLIEHVPHEATSRVLGVKLPITNFFLAIFLSSLIPDLSSEYLLFCDDYYLLDAYPIEKSRQDRRLEDMSLNPLRGRGMWLDALWRTYDLLIRFGYTGYNFEAHIPTYLTKKRVLDAYCEFKDFITEDRWYGMLALTTILNHAYKQEKMPLINLLEENIRFGFWGVPPSYNDIITQRPGKTFFNFDDLAFGEAIQKFLTEEFPDPSRYEK